MMKKGNLSVFESGVEIVSQTSYSENSLNKRKYSVCGSCVNKTVSLTSRGERRMGKLVWNNKNIAVAPIITCYN